MRWLRYGLRAAGLLAAAAIVIFVVMQAYLSYLAGTTYRQTGVDDGTTREIVLRSAVPLGGGAGTSDRQWRLRVPSAYISREVGIDWAGSYFVDLRMIFDPQNLKVRPYSSKSFTDIEPFEYTIHLQNAPHIPSFKPETCYDEQDMRAFLDNRSSLAGLKPPVRGCVSPRCRYYISHFGWEVTATVSHDLYNDKEKYCQIAVDLLTKWTVRRDSPFK
jgi:hypothetical protein